MGQAKKSRVHRSPSVKIFGDDAWNKRMRVAREQAGLSVEEVAEALGITPSAVRQWETAEKFPARANLVEFSAITRAEMIWLVAGVSARDADLAQKLQQRPDPVPFLDHSKVSGTLQLADGGAERLADDDTIWIFPSYPCSEKAFAVDVRDHFNAPDYEEGDIVIIDPAMQPITNDMVLAEVGPASSLVFGLYRIAHDHSTSALSRERLKAAARQLKLEVEDLIAALEGGDYFGVPLIEVVPRRGESYTLGPGFLQGRIVGVMSEHQHPRRAISPGNVVTRKTKA